MSRRVVGYEGEGRHRRAIHVDEGPASASALGIMAILGKGGMPNRELASPSGGAGPIERRQISDAEAAVRREASPTQRAWNGGPIQARLAASPTPTREEPTMPETPPKAAQEPAAGLGGADVQLDRLSVAAEAARRAWETVAVAQTAWQVASEDLARAYAEVEWLLDVTHADVVALPAVAALPKGNTAAQSRANGTAAMLAKRTVERAGLAADPAGGGVRDRGRSTSAGCWRSSWPRTATTRRRRRRSGSSGRRSSEP